MSENTLPTPPVAPNPPRLTFRANGSILVEGVVQLFGPDMQVIPSKEKFSLCRCGQSKSKPFCDGSHKSCGFDSSPA